MSAAQEGSDPLAPHVERIVQDGYTVLEGAIEGELLDALVEAEAELDRIDAPQRPSSAFEGHRTTRHYNVLAKHPTYARLPTHPSVLPLVEAVLDEGCLLSAMSTITVRPGEVAQPVHADDDALRLPRPHPVPLTCNVMVAITPFTADGGATRVVPGSHRRDRSPAWRQTRAEAEQLAAEAQPVEMSPGSALVYLGSLWHGGGASSSTTPRRGLSISYCAGWVRPQENQLVGVPRDVVATFPDRLRVLLGWGVYHSHLGHVDKQRPADLVLGPAPDGSQGWDAPIARPPLRLDGERSAGAVDRGAR